MTDVDRLFTIIDDCDIDEIITVSQVRELAEYMVARGVTVIPDLDKQAAERTGLPADVASAVLSTQTVDFKPGIVLTLRILSSENMAHLMEIIDQRLDAFVKDGKWVVSADVEEIRLRTGAGDVAGCTYEAVIEARYLGLGK